MGDNEDRNDNGYRIGKIWWLKQIVLVILGGFYLYFGIHLLISSYQMNNPLTFMLTFFASNLIILICIQSYYSHQRCSPGWFYVSIDCGVSV
jgi:hypothetical protein